MGVQQVFSAPRSPWQRAYGERVIGSIRRECLDHIIVFHEQSCAARRQRIALITIGGEPISHWTKALRSHELDRGPGKSR